MGISFSIANNKEEIDYSRGYVILEYELGNFLYDNMNVFDFDISLLSKMNPFGDTILNKEQIKILYNICEKLKKHDCFYNYQGSRESEFSSGKEEALEFFSELKKLCEKAMNRNQKIYAKGD